MYRIVPDDNGKFRAFLSIKDVSMVDVILTESMAKFVMNSNEIFAKIQMKCGRALGDTNLSFRVSRSMLEHLFRDGAMEITEGSESISMDFYSASNKFIYSVEVGKQTVFNSMFDFKEKILSEGVTKQFDTEELKELNNLALSTGSILSVCDGVASITTRTNARIYKPVSVTENFALTPKAFSVLRKCSTYAYVLHEYVCAVSKSFVIMVNMVRANPVQDYKLLCGKDTPYKSRYVANVDFTGLVQFLAVRKIKADSLSIDMHNRMVKIESESVKYSIPIDFSDEKIGSGVELNSIVIPMFVLTQIIMTVGCRYRLLKKDEFIMLKSESGLVVLFS